MTTMPLNISRILVPIDFSDPAPRALEYAHTFAAMAHAELVLLYVIEPVAYPAELGVVVNLEADLADRALGELNKLRARHLDALPEVRTMVCHGVADQEIIATAQRESADLIIISTHGFSGLKHLLLGSTAERVVRGAHCPVLSLRQQPA